jgi:hypothetical protein
MLGAAQRDLAADRPAVADLERGDRLARLGDHRLLAAILVMSPTAFSSTFLLPTASPTPMLSVILVSAAPA